mmetsp:Transcript_23645/g.52445  ORF Transcript_23645/g.52445 Transcript_23645/m.52445 type:complete len:678 (-) Transcript_23645:197-2230(-)
MALPPPQGVDGSTAIPETANVASSYATIPPNSDQTLSTGIGTHHDDFNERGQQNGDYVSLPQSDVSGNQFREDPFHEARWRCITWPERARETLGPWAELKLEVVGGRDLVASQQGLLLDPVANASVQIFLDDVLIGETNPVSSHLPRWSFQQVVPIVAPMSMVRLQVRDNVGKNKKGIGFVEVCVGDLPFGKSVSGWLELRFQESLIWTSSKRYAKHKAMREESMATHNVLGHTEQEGLPKGGDTATHHRHRSHGMLSSCMAVETKGGARNVEERHLKAHHLNAGELLVRLEFSRTGSKGDEIFALALEAPMSNFGVGQKQDLNTQEWLDEAFKLKSKLLDDGLLCFLNYLTYIMRWRSFPLSLLISVCFMVVCYYPMLTMVVLPCLLAFLLCLNAIPYVRLEMVVSGSNAPLTEDGFLHVAHIRNATDMEVFLIRVVQCSIGAQVADAKKLRFVAERCMRRGKPCMTLRELRDKLRAAPWVKKQRLPSGTPVLVDQSLHASVLSASDSTVSVQYDDGDMAQESVARVRVTERPHLFNVPGYMIPAVIANKRDWIQHKLRIAKTKFCPLMIRVANVLTWKSRCTALVLVVLLLLMAAIFAAVAFQRANDAEKEVAYLFNLFFDYLDNAVALAIGLPIFIVFSWWLKSFKAIFRLVKRLLTHRRKAPGNWAFYKAEES